ncbi:MAG: antitoxin MazE [Flavobacteriales bacterium]|jgi:antitoxin MazE
MSSAAAQRQRPVDGGPTGYNEVRTPTTDIRPKKLTAIGNSLGVIVDKPVLELLRIDKDTVLDNSTDGDALIIRPLREPRSERERAAALRVAKNHADAFERLAK